MGLTRAQIKADALDILGEDLGTTGLDRPAMLDTWVDAAADELARSTDCYYVSYTTDLFAGQAVYCAPQLYKIKGVFWTDASAPSTNGADGQIRQLAEAQPWELDQGRPGWRNAPVGSPRVYLPEGDNACRLAPTPDTTTQIYSYSDLGIPTLGPANTLTSVARPFVAADTSLILRVTGGTGFVVQTEAITSVTSGAATLAATAGALGATGGQAALSTGGLTLEGFGVPSGAWPNATDACPLPDRAHLGVVWRVAMFRAIQFPTPANLSRLPLLEAEFKRQKGLLEAETHRLSQATAHGDVQRFPFGGGAY